jgi:hypothetical protein
VGSAADTVIEHYYAKSGLYRINLTVWRNDHCVSSVAVSYTHLTLPTKA